MIYIVYYNDSYTEYLMDEFRQNPQITLIPMERESRLFEIIESINLRLHHTLFASVSLNKKAILPLREANESDHIIFFDYLKYSNVKYILNRACALNIHFWFWNTVNRYTEPILKIKNDTTHFHTFDKDDAQKFDMFLHEQIYKEPNYLGFLNLNDNNYKEVDFFFIGQNKHRLPELQDLNKRLKSWGFSTSFIVVDKDLTPGNYEDVIVISHQIPYSEILKMIEKTKIIIDYNKEGQSGLTLRCLEGVFLGKKILTNNANVIDKDIYSPNNILVYDINTTKESLQKFYELPLSPISSDKKAHYCMATWLDSIINTSQNQH